MSNIVSLRNKQTQMITYMKIEELIIINTAHKYFATSFVDIILALQLLKSDGYISESKFDELLNIFDTIRSRRRRFHRLVQEIIHLMSFKEIVCFLYKIGLHQFAKDIWTQRFGETTFFQVQCGAGVSLRTLEYFNSLKTSMDNNIYFDRLKELENRSDFLRKAIPSENILSRKQELVNRYSIVTYQRAALHRDKSAREQILQEMLNGAPNDVDLTLVRLVYYSKMAVTAIHNRDVDSAKRFITEAHQLTQWEYPHESNWVKALVWHDQQYISRCLDSVAPSDEHLRNTCIDGQFGLDVMDRYSDKYSDIMMKIFKTEMAMGLLNITNDFHVDITEDVSEDDKRKAKQFLNSLLRRNSGKMEIRREMIINLCRARICEDDDLNSAKSFARAALELAPEGTHFRNQTTNVARYHSYLQNKTLRKQVVNNTN